MRHLAMLWGLAICLNAAAGDAGGGGGGGGTPPGQPPAGGAPPHPAPPAPPAPPPFDAAKAQAEARAAVLKDLGYDSEDAYKKALDEKKKADDAKLSDQERQKKALDDALDGRGKAEERATKHKERADAAEAALALRDLFDAEGIAPSERRVVEVLLADARDADKKAGKAFDEKAFFADLRQKRAYLFGGPSQQPANTAPGAPPASPFGNGPTPPNGQSFDALTATDEQILKYRNSGYRA